MTEQSEQSTQMAQSLAWLCIRAAMIVPVALLVWWLHRYVPLVPEMGFGGSVALVAIVYVLRRWV